MRYKHFYIWLSSFDLDLIYLGFYVAFNTVQVISRWVVGKAEETSTYSSLGFCTVNCRPTASNYQLSHLRPRRGSNPGLRGGRRECYHSATVAPSFDLEGGAKVKSDHIKDSQPMISYRLVSHCKPLGPITREI